MALVSEAIARYHKLIESEPYIDLAWAQALQERKKALKLNGGVSPVLRPHFMTQREVAALEKASELVASAIERVEQIALTTPALLARMHLLPAERMLAAAEPGYSSFNVATHLHTNLNDASLRFTGHSASASTGVIYGDALADLYYEAPPVKEFRKKFKLKKIGGAKPLLSAILKAYKESGGKNKKPSIAIVEFHAGGASEHGLLAEFFAREGHTMKARTQLDAVLGYQATDRLSFQLGGLNLTDKKEEAYKDISSRWQMTGVRLANDP